MATNKDTNQKNEASELEQAAGKKVLRSRIIFVALSVLLVLVLAGFAYLLIDRNNLKKEINAGQSDSQVQPEEAKRYADEVSRLIEVSGDEVPTLATVSDIEKVKDKPFFANAQNGDKVLLYAKSGRAILYRPSSGKLVEVSTLNLAADSTTSTTTDGR